MLAFILKNSDVSKTKNNKKTVKILNEILLFRRHAELFRDVIRVMDEIHNENVAVLGKI